MKNAFCFLLGVALMTAACSENKSNSNPVPAVPERLEFSKPQQGNKLTKAQIEEIKSTFSNKQTMVLPPGDLVYIPKGMTVKERQKKEAELALQDSNSYQLLKLIQSNCNKGRPTTTFEASFPSNGNTNMNNLRSNDRMSYSSSASLTEKSSCPVDLNTAADTRLKLDDINQSAKTATLSLGLQFNGKGLMLNPTYAQLLGARGLLMQTSLSGLASRLDTTGKALLNFSLSGSYYGLSTEIPYTMTYQILSRAKNVTEVKNPETEEVSLESTPEGSEAVISTELKMSNFTARIDVHQLINSESKSTSEIYVNGNLMSQKEFDDLFGNKNPSGSITNNELVQSLN